MHIHIKGTLLLATAMSVVPHPALAQATEVVPAPQQSGGIEDIVVTAQRRGESLQRVPISVTAVTADKLEASGVESTQDLPLVTPGLVLPLSRNAVTPYIRGIGTQGSTAGVEGAVAVYVDGVYLPSPASGVFSLNNIARIEVLKGPQGTLFGRNATGGLIHVITRDPQQALEASGSIGYANYDTVSGNLYVTGGLANGVAMDLALFGSHQGVGWGRNVPFNQDAGLRREFGARSKLKVDYSAGGSLTLTADYSRFRTDLSSNRHLLPGSTAIFPANFGVGSPPRIEIRETGSLYNVYTDIPSLPQRDSVAYGFSGVIKQDLGSQINLQSTTAYRNSTYVNNFDPDATAVRNSSAEITTTEHSFQQELLLNGDFGPLKLTAGGFYFNARASFDPLAIFSSDEAIQTPNAGPDFQTIYSTTNTRSIAGFAQATYEFLPRTRITGGVRYTRDDKTFGFRLVSAAGVRDFVGCGTPAVPPCIPATERRWNAVTWRAALDHQFSDTIMGYISVNRGFKAGTFNLTAPTAPAVDPETLTAYEAGLKSDLFDRTVRINLSGFYYNYKGIQLQRFQGNGTVNFNAPGGISKGLEVDLGWAPHLAVGRLDLSANATFLHTDYKDFPSAPISTAPGVPIRIGNVAGNSMIQSPQFSSSLSATYERPVSDGFDATFNAVWQHTSTTFFEVDNRLRRPAYDVVNLQLGLQRPDRSWGVRAFVKNAFDKRYFSWMQTIASGAGTHFSDVVVAGAPRTYGLVLDFKFD